MTKKIIGYIVGVLVVITLIIGVILILDVADLQQNLQLNDKKFLLELDRRIEAGLIIGNVKEFEQQETFTFLEDIYQLNDYYIDERYDEMLGDSYKLFILKKDAFEDIDQITFGAINLTTKDAFRIITSFDEREEFSRTTGVPLALLEQRYRTDNELETFLFARLIFSPIEQEGPFWLIKQIKKGNIVIYPKTVTFVLSKIIPDSIFEKMLTEEEVGKIKESVEGS